MCSSDLGRVGKLVGRGGIQRHVVYEEHQQDGESPQGVEGRQPWHQTYLPANVASRADSVPSCIPLVSEIFIKDSNT